MLPIRRTLVAAGAVGVLATGGVVTAVAAHAASSPSPAPSSSSSSGSSGSTGSTTRPTPPKPQPHIDGTVTSVGDGTITVKDPEGFTRTIVTSSSTKYVDGSTTKSASDVTTGKHVHATGTVDANGTSLDASTVDLGMPTPPAGGPGHGDPADGGPRPPAPNGARPSGAPSAAPSAAPSGTPSAPSSVGPTSGS